MRAETGQAVLSATGHLGDGGGPPLSSLVGRLAASRGLPPAAAPPGTLGPATMPRPFDGRLKVNLVDAPPVERQPTGREEVRPAVAGPVAGLVLLAAHGGAGVSTLLRAGLAATGAVDGQRRWPAAGQVLLVARTSTAGLERARELARQHASGLAGSHTELVGLVLVADAPGRLPARIRVLADLVTGGFARCWQVPWLTEWRLAAATEPLPVHPEVARLSADLHTLTTALHRPTPTRGALL
jgi:hypothetical protein